MVFRPSGSLEINSKALASLHALVISSSVASCFAYWMFSLMLQSKRTGSWPTTPMLSLSQPTLRLLRSRPSRVTVPWSGSYIRCTSWTQVDLPHPELPTRATLVPASMSRLRLSSILTSFLLG